MVITMVMGFATRKVFIQFVGVSLLGVDGVITQILGFLSLAELGVKTAIVYSLYRPIHEKDSDKIGQIMALFKSIYRRVGLFVLVVGLLGSFFIQFVITGVEYDLIYIQGALLIQLIATVATYFMAYKRTLLYADQKNYILNIIDSIVNIIINIAKIVLLIYLKSYYGYLILQVIQVIGSNLLVSWFYQKSYPAIQKSDTYSQEEKTALFSHVKNVFAGRIAGFIYASTDNIVISILLGTKLVGYLSNYQLLYSAVKKMIMYLMIPIQPLIGNFLTEESDLRRSESLFFEYTFVRFLLITIGFVPMISLSNYAIELWLGKAFILSPLITILMMTDFYISFIHGPAGEYINGLGLFYYEKFVAILGASLNIITSVLGVYLFGVYGVLIGTVISQICMWIGRSYIVYKFYFKNTHDMYLHYWRKHLFLISTIVIETLLSYMIIQRLRFLPTWYILIIGLVISEVLVVIGTIVFWGRSKEFHYVKNLVFTHILRK